MKKKSFFVWVVPALLSGIILVIGCHLNEKQSALSDDAAVISARADDCGDCGTDCCCFVELDGSTSASLLFCGTSDGASACNEPDDCGGFSTGGQLITLNTTTPRKLFCMIKTNPFRIQNVGMNAVDIIVSCTTESGIPQTIMIHLESTQKAYIGTDGDCEVGPC